MYRHESRLLVLLGNAWLVFIYFVTLGVHFYAQWRNPKAKNYCMSFFAICTILCEPLCIEAAIEIQCIWNKGMMIPFPPCSFQLCSSLAESLCLLSQLWFHVSSVGKSQLKNRLNLYNPLQRKHQLLLVYWY